MVYFYFYFLLQDSAQSDGFYLGFSDISLAKTYIPLTSVEGAWQLDGSKKTSEVKVS